MGSVLIEDEEDMGWLDLDEESTSISSSAPVAASAMQVLTTHANSSISDVCVNEDCGVERKLTSSNDSMDCDVYKNSTTSVKSEPDLSGVWSRRSVDRSDGSEYDSYGFRGTSVIDDLTRSLRESNRGISREEDTKILDGCSCLFTAKNVMSRMSSRANPVGTFVYVKPEVLSKAYVMGKNVSTFEEVLNNYIKYPLENSDMFKMISPPRLIYAYGLPGTGKRTTVMRFLNSMNCSNHKLAELKVMVVSLGEDQKRVISLAIDKAKSMQPCIIFFDNIRSAINPGNEGFETLCNKMGTKLNKMKDNVWVIVNECLHLDSVPRSFISRLETNGVVCRIPTPKKYDREWFVRYTIKSCTKIPENDQMALDNFEKILAEFIKAGKSCSYEEILAGLVTAIRYAQSRHIKNKFTEQLIVLPEDIQCVVANSRKRSKDIDATPVLSRRNVERHDTIMNTDHRLFYKSSDLGVTDQNNVLDMTGAIPKLSNVVGDMSLYTTTGLSDNEESPFAKVPITIDPSLTKQRMAELCSSNAAYTMAPVDDRMSRSMNDVGSVYKSARRSGSYSEKRRARDQKHPENDKRHSDEERSMHRRSPSEYVPRYAGSGRVSRNRSRNRLPDRPKDSVYGRDRRR